MGMQPELKLMLDREFLFEKWTGKDSYGNITYATGVKAMGYIDSVQKQPGSGGGRQQIDGHFIEVSNQLLIVDADAPFVPEPSDRVTTSFDGSVYDVVSVTLMFNEIDPHHYEMDLRLKS
jgi:hypothetical protein